MARSLVLLLLVLVAVIGAVSAATPATAGAPAPNDNDLVGTVDDDVADGPGQDQAVAGPLGSEQEAAAANGEAAGSHGSDATTVGLSAVAGAAAIAGYFVF